MILTTAPWFPSMRKNTDIIAQALPKPQSLNKGYDESFLTLDEKVGILSVLMKIIFLPLYYCSDPMVRQQMYSKVQPYLFKTDGHRVKWIKFCISQESLSCLHFACDS